MVIVGSRALDYWIGEDSNQSSDTDVWVLQEHKEIGQWANRLRCGWDISVIPLGVLNLFESDSLFTGYATLKDQLAIKLSHLPYDIFWHKHKQYALLLGKLTEGQYNEPLFRALRDYWEEEHGSKKSHLSLYKTKDEFFDDFVPKQHEHDYLHELVAQPEEPVYTSCLKDGHEVFIDKDKWRDLTFCKKVRMMREEVAVIALERWLIPTLSKGKNRFSIQEAWNKSLHKVVTQLTKNDFSEFIVLNLNEFLSPSTGDILHALDVLKLKEIYMGKKVDIDSFKEMVGEIVCREGKFEYGFYFDDILLEGVKDQGIVLVEQDGGGEGGSENCYSILKIDGVFYKVNYSYYSHHGFDTEFACVSIVEPKKKLVTVYE